jgi:hypothetical protein
MGTTGERASVEVRVYRSPVAGGATTEVLRFDTSYRDLRNWSRDTWDSTGVGDYVGDLEFTTDGRLVVGLRERAVDASVGDYAEIAGEVLASRLVDGGLEILTSPGLYADGSTSKGTLARFPGRDWIVGTGYADRRCTYCRGANW